MASNMAVGIFISRKTTSINPMVESIDVPPKAAMLKIPKSEYITQRNGSIRPGHLLFERIKIFVRLCLPLL